MNILFFVGSAEIGGAGKMVKFVANLCESNHNNVSLYSFYDATPFSFLNSDVQCGSLCISTNDKFWRVKALKRIRSLVKSLQPDICCAFVSDIASMCRIATLGLPSVFISAERGDPYSLPLIWKYITSWTYKHSDFCFFQLDEAKRFYRNLNDDKCFVIPNPCIISEEIIPFGGERKKTIVTATRFEKEKGVDVLIKAYAKILPEYKDYKLIIYGSGSKFEELKKLVSDLNISECVSFPGYVKNVAKVVREDGIFVLPSRYEGIPNTLIEVLAAGVPSISSNCSPGGPAFLTDNGERGLLFEIDNVEDLTQKLLLLLNDYDLVKKLEKKSVEIKTLISLDRITQLWVDAFLKISSKIKK